jgi:MFS family permease
MSIKNTRRQWYIDFVLLTAISFLTSLTNQVMNNTISLYTVSLGSDTTYSGVLLAIFTVAALIGRFIVGHIIDQRGCRIVSVVGAFMYGTFCVMFELVPDLRAMGLWRVLQGLGFAALGTATGAAVSNVLPQNIMGKGMFIFGLGQSMAICVGPALALSLIIDNDFTLVYWAAGCAMWLIIPLSFICNYPKTDGQIQGQIHRKKKKEKESVSVVVSRFIYDHFEIKAIKPVILQLCDGIAAAFTAMYLSYYAADKPFADAKLFFALAAFAMITMRLIFSSFFNRFKSWQLLVIGFGSGIVSLLIIAFTTNPVVFLLGGVGYGVFHGTIGPVLQTLSVEKIAPERRGAATATYYLSVDIGMGVGSLLWGFLIAHIGFLFADFCTIAGLVVAIILSLVLLTKGTEQYTE